MFLFRDRTAAGRELAKHLGRYARDPKTIVLALPRGGVPVAYEVAEALRVALDVYIVRKIGVPGHEELAMGAVASDGSYVVDEVTVDLAGVTQEQFQAALRLELTELRRRQLAYRDDRPDPDLFGKNVIVVDDGLATGASMYSAVTALRQRRPASIVVAVPVAPRETCRRIERVADELVCPHSPEPFYAVGIYYENFEQTTDREVARLLAQAEQDRQRWKVA